MAQYLDRAGVGLHWRRASGQSDMVLIFRDIEFNQVDPSVFDLPPEVVELLDKDE